MGYVPSYLEYGNRQADGYPVGVSEETKRWAEERVKSRILFCARQWGRGLDLACIHDYLFEFGDRPDDLRDKPLYDWRYAFVDRVLRAIGARAVYVLEGDK